MQSRMLQTLPSVGILFFLCFFSNLSEQFFNNILAKEMKSESIYFFAVVFFIVFSTVIFGLLQSSLFAFSLPEQAQYGTTEITNISSHEVSNVSSRFRQFILKFNDYAKESLRATGVASLWMYLFIIPGLLKWIEFSFIPFIIFLNQDYQNGSADALLLSRRIASLHKWKVYGFWFAFNVAIPLGISISLGEYDSFYHFPTIATLISLLEALILWFWFHLLLNFYQKSISMGLN